MTKIVVKKSSKIFQMVIIKEIYPFTYYTHKKNLLTFEISGDDQQICKFKILEIQKQENKTSKRCEENSKLCKRFKKTNINLKKQMMKYHHEVDLLNSKNKAKNIDFLENSVPLEKFSKITELWFFKMQKH